MLISLILGACVAGLQLVAANAPEHHKQQRDKIKWVTEIRSRPAFPSNGADGWGPYDGKPENHHKSSKHAHDDDNENDTKHTKHGKSKHPKLTHDSKPNKEDQQVHHSKQHKSKHHSDKPSNSKQHHPAHTQGRTQGSAPQTYAGGTGGTYQQQVIQNHNVHRSNHSAPKITWSDSLAATAAKIAAGCVFQHVMDVDGGGYGQNIAAGAPDAAISHVISDQFYNAEVNYFAGQYGDHNPTGFEHWGHFSQLVWKNTAQVGCATQHCQGGVGNTGSIPPYFTVCNYHPPGNVGGQYATNIGKPLGRPTIRGHRAKGKHH